MLDSISPRTLILPLERIFVLMGANVRHDTINSPGSNAFIASRCLLLWLVRLRDLAYSNRLSHICAHLLAPSAEPSCPMLLCLSAATVCRLCRSCMAVPPGDDLCCDNINFPVYYSRTRDAAHWRHPRAILEPVAELLERKGDEVLRW